MITGAVNQDLRAVSTALQGLTQNVTLSDGDWTEITVPLGADTTCVRLATTSAVYYRINSDPDNAGDATPGSLLNPGHEYRTVIPGDSIAFKRIGNTEYVVNVEECQ